MLEVIKNKPRSLYSSKSCEWISVASFDDFKDYFDLAVAKRTVSVATHRGR